MIVLILALLASSANSESLSTRAFYSNFLFVEKGHLNMSHVNFEGFLSNMENTFCSADNVERMIERTHNIIVETFYSCTAGAPKASTFSDAIDGHHSPDSQHYASLIQSALSMQGIKTDFFKTPTHYGIHYKDAVTGRELYWCILTPLAKKGAPKSVDEYVKIFNKYKAPDINGKNNITATDVRVISVDEFTNLNLFDSKLQSSTKPVAVNNNL